jgi:hypothetical protein
MPRSFVLRVVRVSAVDGVLAAEVEDVASGVRQLVGSPQELLRFLHVRATGPGTAPDLDLAQVIMLPPG